MVRNSRRFAVGYGCIYFPLQSEDHLHISFVLHQFADRLTECAPSIMLHVHKFAINAGFSREVMNHKYNTVSHTGTSGMYKVCEDWVYLW